MPEIKHSRHCRICGGTGSVLVEHDPDQGDIYEMCPIAEDEWIRKQKPWDKPKPKDGATR